MKSEHNNYLTKILFNNYLNKIIKVSPYYNGTVTGAQAGRLRPLFKEENLVKSAPTKEVKKYIAFVDAVEMRRAVV